ncbi:hypothetical protein Riv7116_5416 [Rivularia sp. PCC 7116]|nr:hypothetical protein Riv7116_5416 [Rivularia sp. PCC 7116]
MNIRFETPTDYFAIAQMYQLVFGREEEGYLAAKVRS